VISRQKQKLFVSVALLLVASFALAAPGQIEASTYVVYIPLDSSIYDELDELDGLGYLDSYIPEIKPISRVEAARLTLEAERNLKEAEQHESLADAMLNALREQLGEEIGWLRNNAEDLQSTMIHPIDRIEAQYIYSSGVRHYWRTNNNSLNTAEGTPLMPNPDGLPTATGSNEVGRGSGWVGIGGFLTGYGEGAIAGPVTHDVPRYNRAQLISGEAVVSLGNTAISFGQEEMTWGTGHYAPLSQSANSQPLPALRMQSIHPSYLPWILRYLGPGRRQVFMGQLDHDRLVDLGVPLSEQSGLPVVSRPWIVGHVLVFKPLPWLELGMTRVILFGGSHNDHYNFSGFLGRFTGINTGKPSNGQTHSRGGLFTRFRIPWLRNTIVYQEMVGADNLTGEIPTIGRFMPFLSVSEQGGVYVPRLTEDGRTDLRLEYTITSPNYVTHTQSLFWTYKGQLMTDPLGPNASQVNLQVGRWINNRYKFDLGAFYTEHAPSLSTDFPTLLSPNYPYHATKEHSVGVTLDVLRLPERVQRLADSLANFRGRVAVEYSDHINYDPAQHSARVMLMMSTSLSPTGLSWKW
jgi:hypothetical protein